MTNFSGISAGCFHPFPELATHFLAVNAYTPIKAVKALQQLRLQFLKGSGQLGTAGGLVFLKAAKTGADDLAGGLIQADRDFFFDNLCQFWR